MKSPVAKAKNDSMQKHRNAAPDHCQKKANRETLTADIDDLLGVCALQSDLLAAAQAKVILLAGCATGFRACGMIHQTYYNLIQDVPNPYNTAKPQQFDIVGVGISKHKTNTTGRVVYTGLTRHAMADKDALSAFGELLSLEAHFGHLRLLEQIKNGEKDWDRVKIWFQAMLTRVKQLKQKKLAI